MQSTEQHTYDACFVLDCVLKANAHGAGHLKALGALLLLVMLSFSTLQLVNAQSVTPVNPPVVAGQNDTLLPENNVMLPVVIVNSVNVPQLLRRIKNDSSFYKAFKTLHVIGYRSRNHINIFNKKGDKIKASYFSVSQQNRDHGCRSTQIMEQKTTGDFFDRKGDYNYTIGELFASLFFVKGRLCGENNIVAGDNNFETSGLSGIEKKKQQLKMLFFNPGRKIPGIPFIGNKLDVYDKDAQQKYNYRLDTITFEGNHGFVFTITAKPGASGTVIDNMRTIFDAETMDVLYRSYSLSYKAGVYDFDVHMEVHLEKIDGLLLPVQLNYAGNWHILFKQRENARFSANLSNFSR